MSTHCTAVGTCADPFGLPTSGRTLSTRLRDLRADEGSPPGLAQFPYPDPMGELGLGSDEEAMPYA